MKITEEQKNLISATIEELERSSSGEIVAMLAARSSEYLYFRCLLASFLSFILIFSMNFYNFNYFNFIIALFVYIFIFYISKFSFILSLIVPVKVKKHKSEKEAFMEFFKNGIYKTRDKTGIFIYISFLEKQVVVLGDEGINAKIKSEDWQNLVEIITSSFKKNEIINGIIDGLKASNELLKSNFPIKNDDQNELPNKLLIK